MYARRKAIYGIPRESINPTSQSSCASGHSRRHAKCTMNFDEVAAKITCCPPLPGKSGGICANWRGDQGWSREVEPRHRSSIHAQAASSLKLRLRRLSCNGLDVVLSGTEVLFTGLSRPLILYSSSTWGRAVQLASHDSKPGLGRFVLLQSRILNIESDEPAVFSFR